MRAYEAVRLGLKTMGRETSWIGMPARFVAEARGHPTHGRYPNRTNGL